MKSLRRPSFMTDCVAVADSNELSGGGGPSKNGPCPAAPVAWPRRTTAI